MLEEKYPQNPDTIFLCIFLFLRKKDDRYCYFYIFTCVNLELKHLYCNSTLFSL